MLLSFNTLHYEVEKRRLRSDVRFEPELQNVHSSNNDEQAEELHGNISYDPGVLVAHNGKSVELDQRQATLQHSGARVASSLSSAHAVLQTAGLRRCASGPP